MSGFKESSILTKFALLIAVADGVFMICGFASSDWQYGVTDGVNVGYGLWFTCAEPNGTLSCLPYSTIDGQGPAYDSSLRAARGLEFTSFICLCLCALLMFIYLYNADLKHRAFAFVLVLLAFTSVATCMGGLIVYGTSLVLPTFSLSWSFVVTILAMIFAIPMAAFLTIELIKL